MFELCCLFFFSLSLFSIVLYEIKLLCMASNLFLTSFGSKRILRFLSFDTFTVGSCGCLLLLFCFVLLDLFIILSIFHFSQICWTKAISLYTSMIVSQVATFTTFHVEYLRYLLLGLVHLLRRSCHRCNNLCFLRPHFDA